MAAFLAILKIIGIVVLILLCILIAIVLSVLFVPLRYRIDAEIADPQQHDKFPAKAIREHFLTSISASWPAHIITIRVQYPHPGADAFIVSIFGRKIDINKLLKRSGSREKERNKSEKPRESVLQRLEKIPDRIETFCNKADYYWRIATGSCGRRAFSVISDKIVFLLEKSAPQEWSVSGTAGLGDPYHSGKIAEFLAVASPFCADHLDVAVDWEAYRLDLKVNLKGRIRGFRVAQAVLPVLFDRDCRKLMRKFRAAGKRDFSPQGMHERATRRDAGTESSTVV